MQMFVLDRDPAQSARYCCNRHVVCICREVAMQLETWYYHNGYHVTVYNPMTKNQPLVQHLDNFHTRQWAIRNCFHLFREYIKRYHKVHYSFRAFREFDEFEGFLPYDIEQARFNYVKTYDLVLRGLTIDDAVVNYRVLYKEKSHSIDFRYILRNPPEWLTI